MTLQRDLNAPSALGVIAVIGILGYMFFEDWSFMEALYITVIPLTTVGYKEVRELDTSGQLWTMALLTTGVATLFYAAVSAVEIAVEGAVGGYFERKRVRNKIDKLNEHYILGGFGRVDRQVAQEFAADGVPFLIIDQDPQKVEECIEKGYPALLGEASEVDTSRRQASDAHAASSPPSTPALITSSSCSRHVRSTPTFTSLPGPPLMSQPPNCRKLVRTAPSHPTPSADAG